MKSIIPNLCTRTLTIAGAMTIAASCLLTAGCSTPGVRANDKAAAIGNLAPADREIALKGGIHNGFSKDAVFVAWGTPSRKTVYNTPHGPQEAWTYTTTAIGYGGGTFGVARGWKHGKNGDHYDTNDFYPAPTDAQTLGGTPATEVPVKRAVFENGRVVSYQTATSAKGEDDDADNDSPDNFN